jgi:hypothetical protein
MSASKDSSYKCDHCKDTGSYYTRCDFCPREAGQSWTVICPSCNDTGECAPEEREAPGKEEDDCRCGNCTGEGFLPEDCPACLEPHLGGEDSPGSGYKFYLCDYCDALDNRGK